MRWLKSYPLLDLAASSDRIIAFVFCKMEQHMLDMMLMMTFLLRVVISLSSSFRVSVKSRCNSSVVQACSRQQIMSASSVLQQPPRLRMVKEHVSHDPRH